jgi:hypothetical protein
MADKRAPLIKRGGNNSERQIAVALSWLLEQVVILQDRVKVLETPVVTPLEPPDA